jgi:hypothetical protein
MSKRGGPVLVVGIAVLGLVVVGPVRGAAAIVQAPAAQSAATPERTVWYFYKVRWGHQEEFVDLFARNHYPVLKAQKESGRMKSVRTVVPAYHGDGRADWTFAVVITFRDAAALAAPSGEDAIVKRLYPDQEKFKKEEQRRFEILDAHWDVPLNELDLEKR